ncbi:MAG: Rid family hydrolase [Balneolaceae bacterium]|nr:Rid family hydrolase [Balneolaceae bacterium]
MKYQLTIVLICMVSAGACAQDAEEEIIINHFTTEEMGKLDLPFSDAVRVGNMIYLSGVIGNKPGKLELVPGGLKAEAEQALTNIRTVLEQFGSSMDKVIKCTVMIDDISQWGEFNSVYVTYFKKPYPARSAFGADGLALGAAVEVECMATVDMESHR